MKIVHKYGGSSLADEACLRRAAERIRADAEHHSVLVVVSAQGKTTDALTEKIKRAGGVLPSRESDALLSSGEQISAALLASCLNACGCPAISLTASQIPICSSGTFGDGRIRFIFPERILLEWNKGNVVVVTGFQGVDPEGNTVTLGRGGSDTSAVALAAAVNADRCLIFTDVEGICSADPRIVPDAVFFPELSENSVADLALCGAKVLHPRAALLAKQYRVPLEILSSFGSGAGTKVLPDGPNAFGITVSAESFGEKTVSVLLPESIRAFELSKIVSIAEFSAKRMYLGFGFLHIRVSSDDAEPLLKKLHTELLQIGS